MKTLAAVLVAQSQPLVLDELEIPPLEPGQILVEVLCSGLCGSQLGEIDGVKGPDAYLPHLLGHEGCATVLEVGPSVTKVKAGDRVVLHWRPGPGIQAATPIYCGRDLGAIRAGWVTTFNHHAVVSENRVTVVPSETPPEIAALLGCAVTTAMGVLANDAAIKPGESLLIVGAGGVGLSMIQGAALSGAYPIVAVDLVPARLELARQLGASHIFQGKPDSLRKNFAEVVSSGFDVAIDNTGHSEIIQLCYEVTGSRGRVILVGVPRADQPVSLHSLPLHFGKKITGSHGGDSQPNIDIPRYLRLWKAGRLPLESLITASYALENIEEAISDMRSGRLVGRAMLRFK